MLGVAGGAASIANGAATRPATVTAVQSDPYYAAWVGALVAAKTAPQPTADRAPQCATHDELEPQLAELHRRRVELLQSLAARGFAPASAPAGVAPWPWGKVAAAAAAAAADAVVDSSDISMLHDTGTITFVNREGQLEVDPAFATKAFYAVHDDEYDALVLFTTFPSVLAGGQFLAYYLPIANDVTGLGYTHTRSSETFDNSWAYVDDAPGDRLQGFIHMNRIVDFPTEPDAPYSSQYVPVELLGHELGHRWLARIWLELTGVGPQPLLLGRQGTHWSFIANSAASPLEGNLWESLQIGRRWATTSATIAYSPLDLYLMGMLPASEVDHSTLFYLTAIENVEPPTDARGVPWNVGSSPTPDVSCDATPVPFTIADVTLANGYRLPAYPDARREVRVAFALAWNDEVPVTALEFTKLVRMRDAFATWFQGATLGHGSLDVHLTSQPAQIVFEHRPHGDVEDAMQPIPIATRIVLEPRSLRTRLEDVQVTLAWSVNGGSFVETPMASPALGAFTAAIPAQPTGTQVRYWMRATSAIPGHVARWPETDGEAFEFTIAPDASGPAIQHAARTTWSRLAEPPRLRALVRDDHRVESVAIEYRVGAGAWASTPMTVQGVSDIWEARPVFPGRIGDVVEYRIVARDGAVSPHEVRLPANGAFALAWTRELAEDAEDDETLWTHRTLLFGRADQWHREVVAPIAGRYSWKVGPTNNIVGGSIARPQDSVLESPVIDAFPGGSLTIRHRYALLRHMFTIDEAWDGAVVQWQDVERDGPTDTWWLIEPDRGYPFHLFSYETDSALRGLPCFSGYQALPIEDRFSFQPWHWNRKIRLRFRVSTTFDARRASLDGWHIDAIRIDPGPPPTAVALEGLAATRDASAVQLTWRAPGAGSDDAFRVRRATAADVGGVGLEFVELATIVAASGAHDYAYRDPAPPPGELVYRVGLLHDGVETAVLEVRIAVAARFVLHPCVPNPFNPTTRIGFELATAGRARLEVFDVGGRRLRMLVDADLPPGAHAATWDGRDARGRAVASGLYWARLESGGRHAVQRLALVR